MHSTISQGNKPTRLETLQLGVRHHDRARTRKKFKLTRLICHTRMHTVCVCENLSLEILLRYTLANANLSYTDAYHFIAVCENLSLEILDSTSERASNQFVRSNLGCSLALPCIVSNFKSEQGCIVPYDVVKR
jgi:hypothetical protein